MTVSNGQLANQTTFNNAFASKSADNTLTGIQTLANVAAASGSSITNQQREHNAIASFVGASINAVYNILPSWSSNIVGLSTNTLKARAEALTLKFSGTGGHAHTGADGQGDTVSSLSLSSFNQYFAEWGTFDITSAVGLDDTITTQMTGKTAGGGASTLGVPTSAPNNRCEIRSKDTGLYVEDAGGQRVYGRITEAAGVWTITYYTNESGTETAHSLSSQNISVYFIEVYNSSTRPTFGSYQGFLGSLDLTADIVDATATVAGKVSTTAQIWAGLKTFNAGIKTEIEALFKEISSPSTPASGYVALFAKTDKKLWMKDSAGNEMLVGSGGGGGGGMKWYFGDSLAPEMTRKGPGLEVMAFAQTDVQEIFVKMKVPTGYTAGTQIFLTGGQMFSPTNSGNVLWRATSYIYKLNVNGNGTPGSHSSTNTQQAINGTANQITVISDIDLTDGTGQINGVAVAAGNVILVKLTRLTTSETSGVADDVNLIPESFEVDMT